MRRRKPRTWVASVVFVLVVIELGIGLSNGNRMHNPFQVLSELVTIKDELRFDDSVSSRVDTQITTPGVTVPGLYDITLRWGDLRGVLYDWWFIAAVSAVIMILGRPIGFIFKMLRSRLKRTRQWHISREKSNESG